MKSECFSRQASINEDLRITASGSLPSASVPPPGELILEKLEVVESSVKVALALDFSRTTAAI
ncbi:hypothetical protein ACMD2_12939 [Ananas comosus]|uniref:Uncharacterized protein n=1 Tax=Ananas comosus TaxID=4615 RepID=A0A199VAP2_ANACO|nr:hypothetical protein ACMD2_12939 [Ananas comosus]